MLGLSWDQEEDVPECSECISDFYGKNLVSRKWHLGTQTSCSIFNEMLTFMIHWQFQSIIYKYILYFVGKIKTNCCQADCSINTLPCIIFSIKCNFMKMYPYLNLQTQVPIFESLDKLEIRFRAIIFLK